MIPLKSARVVFAGTPEFAVPSLAALILSGVSVDLVLTQPDRRAGRGRRLSASPVKALALEHSIPVVQPAALDAAARASLGNAAADLLIVVAYGLLLPNWLLRWPSIAAVNVHASLLPRWRGAAPIQHALLAGDAETGVSIMQIASKLDAGPVYRQGSISVGADDTSGTLHEKLAQLGAALLVEALPGIVSGQLVPSAQDEADVTYAPKIFKREAVLDWNLPAEDLARRVRAYNPWPVAEARDHGGTRLRIWSALAVAADPAGPPGSVVRASADGIDVATADGILRLTRIQPAGSKTMSAAAYLAAHDLTGIRFVSPE